MRVYSHNASRRRQYSAGLNGVAGNADWDGEDASDMPDQLIIDDAEEQAGEGGFDEVSGFEISTHPQGSFPVKTGDE